MIRKNIYAFATLLLCLPTMSYGILRLNSKEINDLMAKINDLVAGSVLNNTNADATLKTAAADIHEKLSEHRLLLIKDLNQIITRLPFLGLGFIGAVGGLLYLKKALDDELAHETTIQADDHAYKKRIARPLCGLALLLVSFLVICKNNQIAAHLN